MTSLLRLARNVLSVAAPLVLVSACASASGTNSAELDELMAREPADPAEVTAEEIDQAPRAPLLQGRVAGVQVIPTSGGIQIRIRGASSIRGSTEPLYILDGVAVDPDPNGTIPVAINDIESIRVLKDAVDTTLYGSRGANGVIVIRTKR